jgi:predicted aspartyl protease
MNYSHDYDAAFTPAMPVVEVTIQHIDTGERSGTITAIIDSGADSCILPARLLKAIGSEPIRRSQMIGAANIGFQVELHLVIVHLGPITVYGVEAVADKQNRDAIIGRNVLNQLVVTLNGLAGVTEITD